VIMAPDFLHQQGFIKKLSSTSNETKKQFSLQRTEGNQGASETEDPITR